MRDPHVGRAKERKRDDTVERLRLLDGDPGGTRWVLADQKGMMVWWKIGAGTHVTAHSHPQEQLEWIVKGRMEFRIDKECRVLEAGGIPIPGA